MARRYQVRVSKVLKKNGERQYYYVQIGENGEPLNASELYTRREDAERGIHDANPEGDVEIEHQYAKGEGS